MATYKQISYGSSGSDVLDLQKKLNQAGNYGLEEDGVFGSKTQSAVKDYQQKNSLQVDGIAGNETWGSLNGTQSSASSGSTAETQVPATTYTPSDSVKQAEALLQQQLTQKPGQYTSTWQEQLNETIGKILNREDFSYDMNADALYQQYKDQYVNLGKQAMMDTMGQAAALTGGYGNSYAQQAGQQAYQGYLQGLNEQVPELYQLALNKYLTEGDRLSEQASLMAQMEDQEYGRHRDQVSDYYTELQALYDRMDAERNYDYSIFADQRDFDYQKERDKVADEQWQKSFDLSAGKSSGSSGGSSSSSSRSSGGSGSYDDGGLTKEEIAEMQAWYGTDADGVWGSNSMAAADGMSVSEAWEYYQANKGSGNGNDNGEDPLPEDTDNYFDRMKDVRDNGGSFYDEILKDIKQFEKEGLTRREIEEFLEDAFNNSYISQSEYWELRGRI